MLLLVGHHLNCKRDFDDSGGEIAHSRVGFDMHFDDDENYKIRDYDMDGIYFVRVAVHEIGHILGLAHNDRSESIMYPIYQTSSGAELELGTSDRRALQQVSYESCSSLLIVFLVRFPNMAMAIIIIENDRFPSA